YQHGRKSSQRQRAGAPCNAAAAAEKRAGVDDPGTLPRLPTRKGRQRQARRQRVRYGETGAHHKKPDRQKDHPTSSSAQADHATCDRDQRHAGPHRIAQPNPSRQRGSRKSERKQRRAQRQQASAGLQRRQAKSFPALRIEIEIEQQAHDAEHRQRADGEAHRKAAAREEAQVDERRRGRVSTLSSRKSAAPASTNGPTTKNGAARACGNACSPKTSETINVTSKTKPIQSARRLLLGEP